MSSVLHLTAMIAPDEAREEIFKYLELPLNSIPFPQFEDDAVSYANSVWYNKNSISSESFESIKKYGSILPFPIPGAKDIINQYCKRKTHGHISQVISNDLDPLTMFVLINVVYFEGKWKEPFKPNGKMAFHGKTKDLVVDRMELHSRLKISEDEKMVLIPFRKDYEMLIYIGDIPTSEAEIFSSMISNLKLEKVILNMPKFSVDSFYDFDEELSKLKIYKENILPGGSKISHTYQLAKIVVDEKGVTASAATTEYAIGLGIFSPRIYMITVNNPFHYFIIKKNSNVILFAGKINDLGEESQNVPPDCFIY